VVKDRSGQVVSGLKPNDFSVSVDNKLQVVAQFEEVRNQRPALIQKPTVKPGHYSNAGLPTSSPIGLTIILLDLVNTPFEHQVRARSQLIKFLTKSLLPEQFVTILALTASGLRQIHDFTNNNDALISALLQTQSELNRATITESQTTSSLQNPELGSRDSGAALGGLVEQEYKNFMVASQRQLTMEAMVQVAEAFKAIPGRKNLVWTTAGFPFYLYDSSALAEITFGTSADYESVWRQLNDANISVYPIDVRGVFDPLWEAQFSPAHAVYSAAGADAAKFSFWSSRDTMRNFADATGGKACLGQNEMSRCYADTLDDARDYYLVSFYLPPEMRTEGWHKLKVKVNGSYEVRARQGFTVGKQNGIPSSDLEVVEALRSPLENAGLHFSLELGQPHPLNEMRKVLSAPDFRNKPKSKLRGARFAVATVPFKITIARNSVVIDPQQQNKFAVRVDAAAVTENNEVLALFSKMVDGNLTPDGLKKFANIEFTFADSVALPAGRLRVRFAVQDAIGGNLGTLEAPIEIAGKK
jgi:VWFA-related protein